MENKFEITKEIMANADTYMPLALKELISISKARECVKETNYIQPMGVDTQFNGEYGMGPMYCESPSTKARILMTCLMVFYLKVWPDSTDMICSLDDYDAWAKAHVLNQIERFKSTEYREKAFDIISDYREMERHLNSAIYSVLRELNDPVKRFMEAFGTMGSIEGIQEAVKSIEEAKDGIEAERERQESIINNEGGDADAGTDE